MNPKNEKTLSYDRLVALLDKWAPAHATVEMLQRRTLFKASAGELQKVAEVFDKKVVLYLVVRFLDWMLRDLSESELVALNLWIKKYYRDLLLSQFFRPPNIFQMFILFHLKVTLMFIGQHFQDILVDSVLECQLCIVLYHTILGVEINQKSYQLLIGRYVLREHKIKETFSSHNSFGKEPFEKKSVVSVEFKSKKGIESKKALDNHKNKSYKLLRFSKMSFFGSASLKHSKHSAGQEFEGVLKENLRVQPLPKLKKKKMNLYEYKRMLTEPAEADNSNSVENQKENSSAGKHRMRYIFSNQLSSSLKTQYPDHLLFQLNSRKVKLSQTLQNFDRERHLQVMQHSKSKESVSLYGGGAQAEEPCSGRMQVQDWYQVVSTLKRRVYNLRWRQQSASKKQKLTSKVDSLIEDSTVEGGTRSNKSCHTTVTSVFS